MYPRAAAHSVRYVVALYVFKRGFHSSLAILVHFIFVLVFNVEFDPPEERRRTLFLQVVIEGASALWAREFFARRAQAHEAPAVKMMPAF